MKERGRVVEKRPARVLIPFNTVSLYGMERSVIETFDLLRPEVEAHFLLSQTTRRMKLPLLAEIERRGLRCSFFSDKKGWPKIGRPRSLTDVLQMSIAMIRGNLDVLKASRMKDSIYLPSIQYFYFAILAAFMFRLLGRRIIYQFHDLISWRSVPLRLTALFVTDFVHNTETGRTLVVAANPYLKKKKTVVIPITISTSAKPQNDDYAELFSAARNILFVGQVSKHKGIDLLLDAFALLSKSRSDVTLHVVGGCDDLDLKKQLEENRSSHIKYWGYRDDVLSLLGHADLYVQPSPPSRFKESFGRGVVEAMSVGTPAVCFRSGSLVEIVIDNRTGLVCREETAECLAASISKLLDDEHLRLHLAAGARESYEERFSSALVRAGWSRLCRQLV